MAQKIFGGIDIRSNSLLRLFEAAANGTSSVALKSPAAMSADITFTLPAAVAADDVLTSDASGVMAFIKLANANISASAAIAYSKLNLSASIVNADIASAAAIALNKLAAVTASRALVSDGSGFVSASSVTATELGYVSGVTSSIQTQLDAKQATGNYITALTGDVTASGPGSVAATIANDAITNAKVASGAAIALSKLAATTIDRALVSNGSGVIAPSAVTSTELGYVSGVTSAIQTQLNAKINSTEKGAANGVATLDAGGKVPVSQLPNSVMEYLGAWNASTNSPTLADGIGNNGDVYRVSVTGTQNLGSGSITFAVGDFVIYNGSIWQRSPASDLGLYALANLSNLSVSGLASQSLLVGSSSSAVAALGVGSNGQVLTVSAGSVAWATPVGGVTKFSATWITADTATKAVTHNLGTRDVQVEVYDLATNESIMVDSVVRTSTNVVTLTASEAPGAGSWRVVVIG
jgi:hypothetical protein